MLFQKTSHKEKAEHIVKNVVDTAMEKHTGQYSVIFMLVKKAIPGKASLVDPGILAAGETGDVCFKKNKYIDQDQNYGGRAQVMPDITATFFRDIVHHIVVCIWFHIIVSFLFFPIVAIKNGKVKWIDIFLKCV